MIGTINNIAFGGEGVLKNNGKVVFVPFVLPNEKVEFEIMRSKKSHAFAKLLRILEPSPERVVPKCEYYGRCGGCQLQHASYELQLQIKQQFVEEALVRIGKLNTRVEPIIGTEHQWTYRRRIKLHERDGLKGFIGVDGHTFVPITHCEIYSGASLELDNDIFVQAHPEQSERLYGDLQETISQCHPHPDPLPPAGEGIRLLDLYCGIGILTARLAQFGQVTGIELNPKAIAWAKKNHTEPVNWVVADILQVIHEHLRRSPDIVLVNPPRTGLHPEVCKALAQHKPKQIFYTSCMPATLARDLKILCDSGYHIEKCQPYDLFPQTTHVETVVHLCAS